MKFRRGRSIHRTQLYAQLTTMLASLLLATAVFVWWQLNTMRSDLESALEQTGRTVALGVDMELRQMDSLSINILYSNLIKESVSEFFSEYPTPGSLPVDSAYARNTNAEALTNMLIAIMGADRPVKQINLYNNSGGCFGTGLYNGFSSLDARGLDWYGEAVRKRGHRYIAVPEQIEILSGVRAAQGQRYLSLVRQYFDIYNQPQGFVEVIQTYDAVFATAQAPEGAYDPRILIYDREGEQMFPLAEGVAGADYLFHRGDGVIAVRNDETGVRELVCFSDLEQTGFTVAVVLDSAQYYSRIREFLVLALLVFAPIIALFCVVAYFTTRRISSPLMDMYGILSTVDFADNGWRKKLPIKRSGIWEIDVLRDSINQFQQQLKRSTDHVLLLQKQELQSQMLALQSQMNPHFLYNSLSTISAMAEEGLNDEIGGMCDNITTILRYISSNKKPFVRLEEEMEISSIFLNSLKLRFGDALTYQFDFEDDMLDILVPKLAIQLLVENAVKYTVPHEPPWEIQVRGATDGNIWSIQIEDNGPGFSQEGVKLLRERIDEMEHSKLMPSLELRGMGLMNIYVRLRLLYGNGHIFLFGNRTGGGAAVTIGGRVQREDTPL